MDAHYVVVLVHGTSFRMWQVLRKFRGDQPNSPWTNFGPKVRRELYDKALIVEFHWKGWNSHACRLEAVNRLRSVLEALSHEHSPAELYCVGHSHGGNIISMALGDPELEPRISGAICLATPFLHFDRRGLQVSYRDLAAIFGVGLAIPLMIFAHSLHITGPAMMLAAVFTLPVGYFAKKIMMCLRTQTEAMLAELPSQCKASEKFLLIRVRVPPPTNPIAKRVFPS